MGLSLKNLGREIADFAGDRVDSLVYNAKGLGRQLNPRDGGQTFTVPKKPSYQPLPTIDPGVPLPSVGEDGIPTGINSTGSVFRRGNWVVDQGPMLFDPYGKGREQDLTDNAYLRIAPHFKEYQDFQPKEYITSTQQLSRLLGRE